LVSTYCKAACVTRSPQGGPEDNTIELNGHPLKLTSGGELPLLAGEPISAGRVTFAPVSITYLGIAKAGNANCR
jgi:hypothetical protein